MNEYMKQHQVHPAGLSGTMQPHYTVSHKNDTLYILADKKKDKKVTVNIKEKQSSNEGCCKNSKHNICIH